MTGLVRVPGFPSLTDDHDGTPAVLRWLSIHPDGRVVVRTADNRIAYSPEHQMWVQWRLLRDVYREVGSYTRGFGSDAVVLRTQGRGAVVVAGSDSQPANDVVTAMLAAVGVVCNVHGTAAWLGAMDRQTGLHADLSGVEELRVLAAHCRSG